MDFTGGLGPSNAMRPADDYPVEKMARQPNLQQRLDMAVQQAKLRLSAAERARDILARNPDLEELLNIMQQSHF